MDNILGKLSYCVEVGKIDKTSPYPPDMKGRTELMNWPDMPWTMV